MEREVGALVQAFKAELEGCHRFLDEAGCPRVINEKALTLKDRIQTLVLADQKLDDMLLSAINEVRAIKSLLDDLAEFGKSMPQETFLPPLAQRVYDALTDLQTKVHDAAKPKRARKR